MQKIVLDQLPLGVKARICHMHPNKIEVQKRLLDLGVCEGMDIYLKQTTPFNGPLILEVNGQLVGLRKNDAKSIEVVVYEKDCVNR